MMKSESGSLVRYQDYRFFMFLAPSYDQEGLSNQLGLLL